MKQNKKVLHVIDSLGKGGAEKLLYETLKNWKSPNWEFEVACLHKPEPYGPQISQLNIPVKVLSASKYNLYKIIVHLFQLLKREKWDIIHCHLIASTILVPLIARFTSSAKILIHDHCGGLYTPGKIDWLYRRILLPLEKQLWRKLFIICVSDFVARYNREIRQISAERIKVLVNAIDLNNYPGTSTQVQKRLREQWGSEKAVIIGYVGRLIRYKGVDLLISAFKNLVTEFPDIRLVIIGDGRELKSLQRQAAQLGIKDLVIFLGYQANVAEYLPAFDIFVLPSRWETYGLAALEAMASGIPVVATKVGGLPEFIQDKVNGLLVPPEDVKALTEAIKFCIQHSETARTMALEGQKKVRAEHSIENYVCKLEQIYREILNRVDA